MDQALSRRRSRAPNRSDSRRWICFARRRRDAPAIYYFDAALSYAEIDRAERSSRGLAACAGVGRGDRVAIILQNTPQFLIATVAAWKLGAIVVSLNPMYRARRARETVRGLRAQGRRFAMTISGASSRRPPRA